MCSIIPLNFCPIERLLAIVFFLPVFTEVVCAGTYYGVCVITLDLLCSHSNAVPQDLERTIRDAQPVGSYPNKSSSSSNRVRHRFFIVLTLSSLLTTNFKSTSCHALVDTDLCPATTDS
jgi:hypothetical protein